MNMQILKNLVNIVLVIDAKEMTFIIIKCYSAKMYLNQINERF